MSTNKDLRDKWPSIFIGLEQHTLKELKRIIDWIDGGKPVLLDGAVMVDAVP